MSASNFPGASDGESDSHLRRRALRSKFDGTFDGVPGEYSCTTQGDVVLATAAVSKGELTGLDGVMDHSFPHT